MATTFKMHLHVLFLIQLGCCINIIPSQAQTTYAGAGSFIPPKLFNFDANSCTSTEIGTLETSGSGLFGPEGGLALCPDGEAHGRGLRRLPSAFRPAKKRAAEITAHSIQAL